MSDAPQAPGWWQASDGRWYPPEQAGRTPAAPHAHPPQDEPSRPPSSDYPPPGGYGPPPGAYGNPSGGYAPPGYGPPGGYRPGYPSVPPPRSSGANGCLVALLVVLALAVLGGVGSCVAVAVVADDVAEDVSDDFAEEQSDEADDVSEPRCQRGQVGELQAVMTVTNDSSERSNYTIEVSFNGADGSQLDTGYAPVTALAPGQSTEATASSVDPAPPGEFTCEVVDVERYSDES